MNLPRLYLIFFGLLTPLIFSASFFYIWNTLVWFFPVKKSTLFDPFSAVKRESEQPLKQMLPWNSALRKHTWWELQWFPVLRQPPRADQKNRQSRAQLAHCGDGNKTIWNEPTQREESTLIRARRLPKITIRISGWDRSFLFYHFSYQFFGYKIQFQNVHFK